MLIRHYTRPHWVKSILRDGYIDLEAQNFGAMEPHMRDYSRYITEVKGDQVWFTSERHCNTANELFKDEWKDYYFEFDTEDIDVQKWHYFKKTLTHPKAEEVVGGLDRAAKKEGDDPYCYWVSEKPVPIAKAKKTGILAPDFEVK